MLQVCKSSFSNISCCCWFLSKLLVDVPLTFITNRSDCKMWIKWCTHFSIARKNKSSPINLFIEINFREKKICAILKLHFTKLTAIYILIKFPTSHIYIYQRNIIIATSYENPSRRIFLLAFSGFIRFCPKHACYPLYHLEHGITKATQTSREDNYISAQLHMKCWSKQVRHWNFCRVMPRTHRVHVQSEDFAQRKYFGCVEHTVARNVA